MNGIALCAASPLPDSGGDVPDWIHLLPAGTVYTADGRGPYRIRDAAALMARSLPRGGKLVLDENHATDLNAPKGGASPARGWITELQMRNGGIWGRVDWTGTGRQIVADRQYRGVSPVLMHDKDGTVTAILRAGLVNVPNLIGLKSLHAAERHAMDKSNPIKEAQRLAGEARSYQMRMAAVGVSLNFQEAVRAVNEGRAAPLHNGPQSHHAAQPRPDDKDNPIKEAQRLADGARSYQMRAAESGVTLNFAAAMAAYLAETD